MKANRAFVLGVLLGTCCTMLAWTSARGIDYTWNAGSGEWGTAANWNPSGVPGAGDVLFLSNGGTIDLGGNRTVARVGATGAGNGIVGTLAGGSLHFTTSMYVRSGTVDVNLSNAGGSSGRLWIGGDTGAIVLLSGNNTHTYSDNYATIIGHSTTGAAGTVRLGDNNALGGTANRTDLYAGILDLNGQNAVVQNQIRLMSAGIAFLVNSNTAAEAGTAADVVMQASNSIGGAGNMTLSGVVSGGGTLTKIGAGKLTLSGTNTFSGALTVLDGTLSVPSWNANNSNGPLGNSSTSVVLGGAGTMGTLEVTATGGGGTARRGIELAEGGTGMVHLAPATGTRSTNYIHIDGSNITGSGAFIVDTSYGTTQTSRFIIVGSTGITGPVTVNPYSELQSNLANDGTPFGTGTITVSANAILGVYNTSPSVTATLGGLAGSGILQATDSAGLKTFRIGSNNENTHFSGVIRDGAANRTVAISKIGTGTLTLSGINTYTGDTRVENGTLSITSWNTNNNNGPLGNSSTSVVLGGAGTTGTLQYTGPNIGAGVNLRGIEAADGSAGVVHLLFSDTGTTYPPDETYRNRYIHTDGNKISGSGALTIDTRSPNGQIGGRVIITNPGGTAFSGPLTVAPNSELQLSAPSDAAFAFGSGTVTVNAGGILNLWRSGDATVTLGGLAGDGLVRGDTSGLKTYRIGSNDSDTEFSGTIVNGRGGATVALTKVGTGTLTLSGINTFSGPLRVEEGGTLALAGANTFSGQVTVAEGTLRISSWNNDNTAGPLGNSSTRIILGGNGTAGTLEFPTAGGYFDQNARRGVEIAAGGTGTIHLTPSSGTRSSNYIHIAGNRLTGSGTLVVDTSHAGVQRSRLIVTSDAQLSGPIIINPYSELQANLASAGDNTPFGTGTVTVSQDGILTVYRGSDGNGTAILGGLAGAGIVRGESAGTKTFKIGANHESTEFSGVIQNNTATHVAVTKFGEGTLTLSGNNTFTGVLSVEDGTLSIGTWNNNNTAGPLGQSANKVQLNGGTIQYTGGSVGPNKSLHMAGPGTIDVVEAGTVLNLGAAGSNTLTGNGDITKEGLGTLQLAQAVVGQWDWGGKLIINAGTVDFFGSDSMPKPTSVVPDAVQINDGGSFAFSYSGTSPSASQPNANIGFQLSGHAGFAITAGTHTLQGVIANKPGYTGNLIKSGGGTLVLSGDNTFTGATNVSAGTLLVNGSTHASSAVTVQSGGTLGGTGTVGGPTTVQAGGRLATGNSIGTLSFGSPLTLNAGAVWDWEFIHKSPGNHDQAAGPQLVLPTTGAVTFNIHGLPGHSVFPGDKFTVFTGDVENFSPERVALVNHSKWTSWQMSTGGSLVLTADPTISLSTDVLNAGQANPGAWNTRGNGYSNAVGVELVRFVDRFSTSLDAVAYTQVGTDTIDVSGWVVTSGTGGQRGASQGLQVNGYSSSNTAHTNPAGANPQNLYLRGEPNEYNEGFGAHANWIVTFDLDVIRQEHFAGTRMPLQLTGEFGTWGGIGSTGVNDGVIQGAIFLDGVRIDDMDPSIANPQASIRNLEFDLTIYSGRYLTFGIFNDPNSTVWDDGVFKNVNLTMIPEPGAWLMLLAAGAAGLLFRWRWRP